MKKLLRYLYFLFCKGLFKFYCPLTVQGKPNLPSTSFILCSNHNSHFDSPVLMLATGLPFNRFGMIAAKDYFFDNLWRKLIVNNLMNLIPLDRRVSRSSLVNNITACKQFIGNEKHYLIIYPEGTRSITGEMQPFKQGAALLGVELSLPLVPVYIEGTYKALRKGRFFPTAGKIRVTIGNPIETRQNKKQITQLLEESIRQLKNMNTQA